MTAYWTILKQTGRFRAIIRNRWMKAFNYDFPLIGLAYSHYREYSEIKIALIGFEAVLFIDKKRTVRINKDDSKQPWNLRKIDLR